MVEVDPVAKLLEALAAVMADSAVMPAEYLTDGDEGDLPESLQGIDFLACEALICTSGRPNFLNHGALVKHGYRVTCGEKDSFGWLTGVIHTPKGRIVYG